MITVAIVPDLQLMPGVRLDFLRWIVRRLAAAECTHVVQLGDWADMASLSTYDKGKKVEWNRYTVDDIECANLGMAVWDDEAEIRGWFPRKLITLGNHEDRISRALASDAKMEGLLGMSMLKFAEFGWQVAPFLEPMLLTSGGAFVSARKAKAPAPMGFCHYLETGSGNAISSPASVLQKAGNVGSFFCGHMPGLHMHRTETITGTRMGVIAGSCYPHDMHYKGSGSNGSDYRGFIIARNVDKFGGFDIETVSLESARRDYE